MSFVENNSQQLSFDDILLNLTSRERKFLDRSWAKHFADHIFPAIDEKKFSVLYSDKASRPNTPVNVIIGAMVLKELLGLTDDEVVEALMFDIRFQYALHTTSFQEQPLSDKTLARFRRRCYTYEETTGVDLIRETVLAVSSQMATLMKISGNMKRMDSLMIASNIKDLSLLELLYKSVSNLVKYLKANQPELIPEELARYHDATDYNNLIYHNRSTDTKDKINQVLSDASRLIKVCNNGTFDEVNDFQLLIRVIKERTIEEEDGTLRLKTKEEKNDKVTVLVNPSDPDATLRNKGGKYYEGYVANITQSTGKAGSMIDNYQYGQNITSDNQFIKEIIQEAEISDEKVTIVADGGYAGAAIKQEAKDKNIDLITTNLSGSSTPDIYADFVLSEDNQTVIKCPAGHTPKRCTTKEKNDNRTILTIYFDHNQCENCPNIDKCKPKKNRRSYFVRISKTSISRARLQREIGSASFQKYKNYRNGIEGVNSVLRRKYNVDKMPVRGLRKTKLHFGFKVFAYNFSSLCRHLDSLVSCPQKAVLV